MPCGFSLSREPVIFTCSVFYSQLESLEGMYSEILTNMDVESKDSKSSNNKNSQRAAALQGMSLCECVPDT